MQCKQFALTSLAITYMIFEALAAATLVALASLTGALFFGNNSRLIRSEKFIVPITVGVFLSLVLYELIPETLSKSPEFGGIAVMVGFISFYILSSFLHERYHKLEADECDRKGAAALVLIGDAVHNLADGFILGSAFLIDPSVGVAVAIGLALHEIPQEIVEFGVLIRAGYTRTQAALRNLLSASSIIVGTVFIILISDHASEYVWMLTGFAAGNLLFLAASDLLPRIHDAQKNAQKMWSSVLLIVIGFAIMSGVITWTHHEFGHTQEEEHHAEDGHEGELH